MNQVPKNIDICKVCNRKLGLTPCVCKCGDHFCAKHRYSNEHNCPFDYKKMQRDLLTNSIQRVVSDKITRF